jgi:hypothetical protein
VAEKAVEELVGQIEQMKEGDRDQGEHTGRKAVSALGRTTLEELLKPNAREEDVAGPALGTGGHPLRPVSNREKQVSTIRGH